MRRAVPQFMLATPPLRRIVRPLKLQRWDSAIPDEPSTLSET